MKNSLPGFLEDYVGLIFLAVSTDYGKRANSASYLVLDREFMTATFECLCNEVHPDNILVEIT